MTISRDEGLIYYECDSKRCAEILTTDTKDFEESQETLKEAGWATRNVKGQWLNICPDCQEREYELAL